jgi:hypothetical protein
MSEQKNVMLNNTLNVLNSLSFYAPLIICMSILLISMFTSTMEKASVFFLWFFVITCLRILAFTLMGINNNVTQINPVCLTGNMQMFIPSDVTYSIYILCFSLAYFFTPMVMLSSQSNTNAINYGVLAFFMAYIALDIFIKKSLSCIQSVFSSLVIGDILSGLFLGAIIAGPLMYGTKFNNYLYINEINTNKEVCSMPTKQQFKCSVYKNGELVGSSIN